MIAEFEAGPARARTGEVMAVARAKGRLRGKQPKLSTRQEAHLVELYRAGAHTIGELEELMPGYPLHRLPRRRTRWRGAAEPHMTEFVAWPNGRDLPRLDLLRLPAPRRRGDPHVRDGRRARYCCPVSVCSGALRLSTWGSGPALTVTISSAGRICIWSLWCRGGTVITSL